MRVSSSLLVLAVAVAAVLGVVRGEAFTLPFYRNLEVEDPPLTGSDVVVYQNLISRSQYVSSFPMSGEYDMNTAIATKAFQEGAGVSGEDGYAGPETTTLLLKLHSYDGYRDNGTIPEGYMYKVVIGVYADRSIESSAALYGANGTLLHSFVVRTEGQNDTNGNPLNMFSSDGATPTGLMTFDLNSPEPDPMSYGPYPVNRAVTGLEGNAAFLISDIRNGILMHTGEWPGWTPPMPMPDSHGCVHGWPQDIKFVWEELVALGVVVHKNPFNSQNYPYKPQGLLSIMQLDV